MGYKSTQIDLAIQHLCAGLIVNFDYELSDLGQGPVISQWRTDKYAQPTVAQLQAVDTEALALAGAAVLPQDLMKQLTANDMTKIQAAISSDATKALLWYAMVAQRDPMVVGNARFKAGWDALLSVLGPDRLNAIASALGVTVF